MNIEQKRLKPYKFTICTSQSCNPKL